MAAVIEIKYFNTFLLKKVFPATSDNPIWGGSFGIPTMMRDPNTPGNPVVNAGWPIAAVVTNEAKEWFVEESRIRGGYNNLSVDFGVKAYIVDTNNTASVRPTSLIYSGIFNSRTGINNTNQFSVGEEITKTLDPANGSIQKLYAEDTNLIVFQENKVSRALIDKDAIYSAEGAGTLTSSNVVIGQVQPYAGAYGISQDPGSFAVYGYRKYFTDRFRNAVLRLSQDGITEISQYGMTDYFRDEFNNISNSYGNGIVIGGWDVHNKQYVVSTQQPDTDPNQNYKTLGFSEEAAGFTSFYSYKPSQLISLKNKFYSLNNGKLWLHYNQTINTRGQFYGVQYGSAIRFIFNEAPSNVKIFKTVNYEGSNGWMVSSFKSDFTGPDNSSLGYVNNQDVTGVLNGILTQAATVGTVTGGGPYVATITPSTIFPSNLLNIGDTVYSLPNTSNFTNGVVTGITVTGSNITSFVVSSAVSFTSGSISQLYANPAIFSYATGAYDDYGNSYPATLYPPINRAGFDRKENKYMAVLMNKSEPNQEEIIYGNEMTGIKGYFAVVDMSLDNATDVGGPKELFAASCNYDFSVY
jgi:hypothetical protein